MRVIWNDLGEMDKVYSYSGFILSIGFEEKFVLVNIPLLQI